MGYLADCECSGQNSRPIPIEEKFGGFCYDNFMFKDAKPWIHRKGSIKRKLYKWALRAKWVKFY